MVLAVIDIVMIVSTSTIIVPLAMSCVTDMDREEGDMIQTRFRLVGMARVAKRRISWLTKIFVFSEPLLWFCKESREFRWSDGKAHFDILQTVSRITRHPLLVTCTA